ncbi:MAG: TfpX/TfpZ family type IV pilin accessory protein [Lysobacterales bacterium]
MTRYRAAAIHLSISAVIGASTLALLYFLWYPAPYFELSGGRDLAQLLVSVDVVLGPLLTLIVFSPGKKTLRMDLSIIAAIQLSALAYGLWVMAQARPVYAVFAIDRLVIVAANQIDAEDLHKAKPPFDRLSWSGPQFASVEMPTDPQARNEAMDAGLAGKELEHMPQYFQSYAAAAGTALRRAKPLAERLQASADARAMIEPWLKTRGLDAAQVHYLPVTGRKGSMTALLDGATGSLLGVIDTPPWD